MSQYGAIGGHLILVHFLNVVAHAGSDVPLPIAASADFVFHGQISAISQ